MARQEEEQGVPKVYTVGVHGGCRHVYRNHVCSGMLYAADPLLSWPKRIPSGMSMSMSVSMIIWVE